MAFKNEKFTFSDSTILDVSSDATSNPIVITEGNIIWNVTPEVVTSVTGSPTYTIQVSNNNKNWFNYFNYDDTFVDLAIPTGAGEVDSISFLLIRIVVTSNAATGTVEFTFNSTLKNKLEKNRFH